MYVIEEINLNPKEIIFIDDSLKNLSVAEEIGFKVIHFINLDETLDKIRKYEKLN